MEPEKLKGNDLKPCRENLDVSNRYVHLHSIPRLSVEKRTFIRIGGSDIESIESYFDLTGDAEERRPVCLRRHVIRGSSFA